MPCFEPLYQLAYGLKPPRSPWPKSSRPRRNPPASPETTSSLAVLGSLLRISASRPFHMPPHHSPLPTMLTESWISLRKRSRRGGSLHYRYLPRSFAPILTHSLSAMQASVTAMMLLVDDGGAEELCLTYAQYLPCQMRATSV